MVYEWFMYEFESFYEMMMCMRKKNSLYKKFNFLCEINSLGYSWGIKLKISTDNQHRKIIISQQSL